MSPGTTFPRSNPGTACFLSFLRSSKLGFGVLQAASPVNVPKAANVEKAQDDGSFTGGKKKVGPYDLAIPWSVF